MGNGFAMAWQRKYIRCIHVHIDQLYGSQRKGASFCIYVCGGKHFDKPCLHTQVYGCRFASRHVIYIDSVGSILIYILLSYEGINRSYISFIFIYTPVSCEGVHRCWDGQFKNVIIIVKGLSDYNVKYITMPTILQLGNQHRLKVN